MLGNTFFFFGDRILAHSKEVYSKSGKFALAKFRAEENKTCVRGRERRLLFEQRQIKRQRKCGSERGQAEKGGLSGDREYGQLSLCATIDPFLRTGKLSGPSNIFMIKDGKTGGESE